MVSTQQKLINTAKKRSQARAAGAMSSAFNQKQSQYARRAEEERVREDTESAFASAKHVSARRPSAGVARVAGRKQSKFNLDGGAPEAPSVDHELGELLGARYNAPEAAQGDEGDARDPKQRRREKFEDVISTTRKTRADFQKEREDRDKEATALDAEFDDIAHLVPKRDKVKEDVDNFATLGRPDVLALLREHAAKRASNTGRKFVLDGTGNLSKVDGTQPIDVEAARAAVGQRAPLEEYIAEDTHAPGATAGPSTSSAAAAVAAKPAAKPSIDDDFDAMLGSFKMELRKAHAVERVLSPEEEAAREVQQQLMQMDREARPVEDGDKDRTKAEWLAAGGDSAFQMDEEFDPEDGSAPLDADRAARRQGHAVDEILGRVEAFAQDPPESVAERSEQISAFASEMWHAAVKQKKRAEESFKLLLIDCQRLVYRKRPLTRFHRLALYLATKVFPTTDFRHAVVTPLMLLLSSLCLQTPLTSVARCHDALWYAALLLHTLSASGRFAGEPIAVALNVVALQLPKQAVLPTEHGTARGAFPVLERPDEALLRVPADATVAARPLALLGEEPADDDAQARMDALSAGYRLLLNAAELYGESPSFGCIFETSFVQSFHRIARSRADQHAAVAALHTRVVERVAMLAAETAMSRTPLAMRTFRPRPLRQFEPLLGDELPSEKRQLKVLKQEYHADHKRVMRTLTAEARVEQREREATKEVDEARRRAKLNSIMAELQQQQHVMKTADTLKTKAGMRRKAATNVVPKASE